MDIIDEKTGESDKFEMANTTEHTVSLCNYQASFCGKSYAG